MCVSRVVMLCSCTHLLCHSDLMLASPLPLLCDLGRFWSFLPSEPGFYLKPPLPPPGLLGGGRCNLSSISSDAPPTTASCVFGLNTNGRPTRLTLIPSRDFGPCCKTTSAHRVRSDPSKKTSWWSVFTNGSPWITAQVAGRPCGACPPVCSRCATPTSKHSATEVWVAVRILLFFTCVK